MKFLFRSGWGESLAIARRVESEGNFVRFSIVEKSAQAVGQGLITKTRDFLGSASWADVVVFDSNPFDMPAEAEKLRLAHKPVVGSSKFSGELEKDRGVACEVARRAGLTIPQFVRFQGRNAWRKAKQFLGTRDEGEGWVWKHNGDSETASTFVAGDVGEMMRMLTYFEALYGRAKESPDFILSEKIEGVEVSTEAWFNGKTFVLANNTLEKNRFFNDDLGEKTGCAGNVVWAYPKLEDSLLFEALLKPLIPALTGRYCGPVDVNALVEVESNEPVFLEFTPRFGYDAIFALSHLVDSDLAGLLADMATGKQWGGRWVTDRFSGALRVHSPPYPEEEPGRAEDVPIFGFDPAKVEKGVSPCEVKLDRGGEPVTSGPNGYDFVLSALEKTPHDAMKAAEPTKLCIPLMRYRTDLCNAIQEVYDDLVETGWVGEKLAKVVFGRGR